MKAFRGLVALFFFLQQAILFSPAAFANQNSLLDPHQYTIPETDPASIDVNNNEEAEELSGGSLEDLMRSDYPLSEATLEDDVTDHEHFPGCGHEDGPSDGPQLHVTPGVDPDVAQATVDFFDFGVLSDPDEEITPYEPETEHTYVPSPQIVSFSEALESGELREDYASAVVLQEPFTRQDLEALRSAEFEIAVGVIEGQLVAFTSGQREEISMTSDAYRYLKESATFFIHNHPDAHEGPSDLDYNKAIAAPYVEYVIDHDGIHRYNDSGSLGTIGETKLLENLAAMLAQGPADEVAARAALNFFIVEQDRYNIAHEVEKTIFRGSASLVTPLNSKFIYLNFHGQSFSRWGSYSNVNLGAYDRDGNLNHFSTSELNMVSDIIAGMTDHFSPFDLEVFTSFDYTDDEITYGPAKGLEVVMGSGNSNFLGGSAGGVAYLNSWTTYNSWVHSVLVFEDNLGNGWSKYVVDAGAHEVGHAFGLYHSSDYTASGTRTREYHVGDGHAAPTMGVGYSSSFTLWADNPAYNPNRMQEDLSILTNAYNAVGYRADDHSSTFADATLLMQESPNLLTDSGIIEQIDDQDFYYFSTATGNVTLTVDTITLGMLDPRVSVYNAAGTLVATRDIAGHDETLTLYLAEGNYYAVVESTGTYVYDSVINGTGYHLGMYDLIINVPPGSSNPDQPNDPPPPPDDDNPPNNNDDNNNDNEGGGSETGHSFTTAGNPTIGMPSSNHAFSPSAAYFDATGDALMIEDHDDFDFGTGEFTVDFWVNFEALQGDFRFIGRDGEESFRFGGHNLAGNLYVTIGGAWHNLSGAWHPQAGEWYHVALSRDSSGNVRVFINGEQRGATFRATGNASGTKALKMGVNNNNVSGINAWFDEFRVSNGTARWTSDFSGSLPTAEYTRDDDTSFLLHMTQEEFEAGSEMEEDDPTTESPEGTISINGGAALTRDTDLTLSLSVTDNVTAESAMEMAFSVDGGTTFSAFEAFNATKNVTLSTGDGTKTVVVRYRDEDGNTADFSDTITLDQTAPAGSVTIQSDAAHTSSTSVNLTILGIDAVSLDGDLEMAISVDGGTTFGAFESYATSKSVTLPSGDGTKTVALILRDEAGNTTEVSDTILLDQTVPSGSVLINNGSNTTGSSDVTLTLDATDAISETSAIEMSISLDGGASYSDFEAFSATKLVTLPGGYGQKMVVVIYRDEAGNTRSVLDTIDYVEFTDPSEVPPNGTVTIQGGANSTNDTSVTLNLSAWDARTPLNEIEVAVSVDGGNTFTDFQSWTSTMDVTLPSGEGTKTVIARFRDGEGNSRDVSDTIIMDLTPPTASISFFEGSLTTSRSITLFTDVSDDVSADRDMQLEVSVDGNNIYTSRFGIVANTSLTLPAGDGTKTVVARVVDEAGNAITLQDTIVLDESGPTGSISIYNGATHTSSSTARLTLTASDAVTAESSIEMAFSVDGGTTFSAYESFNVLKALIMPSGDGMKTVIVRYRDESGHVTEYSDTIYLDETNPTGSVTINGGDATTEATDVTLTLDASDAVTATGDLFMAISVDGGDTFSDFESFASTKDVTLPGGIGTKTVAVIYRDEAGNIFGVTDTIDFVNPALEPPTGTVSINSDASHTNQETVSLSLSASDNLTPDPQIEMAFSVDGGTTFTEFESFAASKSVTLPVGDGAKTVVVRYRDGDGNTQDFSDTITLDQTNPSGSVRIDEGTYTNSRSINLSIAATDALTAPANLEMAVSVNGGSTFEPYESFSYSRAVTLNPGDGAHLVVVRVRDQAGNVINFIDNIILDENGPSGTVSINGGDAVTTTRDITLTLSANDVISETADLDMQVSVDGGTTFDPWEDFSASKNVILPSGNGTKTVVVRYRDEAGQVTTFSDTIDLQVPVPPRDSLTFTTTGDPTIGMPSAGAPGLGETLTPSAMHPFSSSAVHFDSTADSISINDADALDFGTGEFTVDFWVNFETLQGNYRFMGRDTDQSFRFGGHNLVGNIYFSIGGRWTTLSGAWRPETKQWYHVALSRDSLGDVRVFVDGEQKGATVRATGNASSSQALELGVNDNNVSGINAWMDEVRISNGIARWTSDFSGSLPTAEATRDANTSLLLHMTQEEFDAGSEMDDADPTTVGPDGSISINGGDSLTNNAVLSLALSATDNLTAQSAIEMAISTDGGATFGAYESFAATKSLRIPVGDGLRQLVVRYRDEHGNTADFSDSIYLDQTVPQGSMIINGGQNYTSSRDINLTISGSDAVTANSALEMAVSVDSGATFSATETLATSRNVTLPDADGLYIVVVSLRDEAGNVEYFIDSVYLDRNAPSGSVVIDGGAASTADENVTLTLSATDTISANRLEMAFSVDGGTTFTDFESYATSKNLTLPTGDGTKTVIVRYRDETGNTRDVSDTILLDQNGPTGSVVINNGSTGTTTANVTLNLSANDLVTATNMLQMAISVDGGTTFGAFESFAASKDVTLPAGDGTKTVVVRYRDESGFAADFSDTILLDQNAPTGSVVINSGDAIANTTNVRLTLTASDAVSATSALQMAISVDGGVTFSAYESFAATKDVRLPAGDGTKTVVVRILDEAGNTFDVMDTIDLENSQDPLTDPHNFTTTGNPTLGMPAQPHPFSSSAAYFDDTADSLTIEDSDALDFGTGEFTVDFWVNFETLQGNFRFMGRDGDQSFRFGGHNLAGNLYFSIGGTWHTLAGAWYPKAGEWSHVALSRDANGDVSVFVNGEQKGKTVRATGNASSTKAMKVGVNDNNVSGINAYMDELRFSKGVSRWTSDFSNALPTAEATRDADTSLLLHMTQEEFDAGSEV